MKKTLGILVAMSLVFGAFALPAEAKKKKKAKPVATTLYFHGPSQLGEIDGAQWFADLAAAPPPLFLDATEPAAGPPKSQALGNPALNTQCSGLPVGFPTFQGDFTGTIVGDATIVANFVSPPGPVTARLWTDTPNFSCNDAYIEPASEVQVTLPPGSNEVEIVFPDLKLSGQAWILVELLGSGTAYPGRLLYDSTDAMTRLEFNCIPASGTSCVP